jgi:DNA-directed RNA polymerase subunit RPC12/RpoP
MEILNKLYPALNASNNLFESNIQSLYKNNETSSNNQRINELTSTNQYISSLRNIDEIRKFNELRNAILSNKNLRSRSTLNSITIPSSTSDIGMMQNEQNSNINISMDNIVQNQLINRIVNPNNKNEISNINISNINLFNQNSILNAEKYNSPIPSSLDIMDNYCTSSASSNANLLNGLNDYTNLNPNLLSSVQMNKPTTLPLNQNSLFINSSPLFTISNSLIKNNNLLNKDQLQLLYLAKLFKDQKEQMIAKERKSKFNSMIIPSNESIINNSFSNNSISIPLNEQIESNLINNLANNSITVPSTETTLNNLINNSTIKPLYESNENSSNNNSFISSITVPVNCDDNSQDELSDKLLKQFQLQEQQLASKISENSCSDEEEREISGSKKDTLLEIPSITLNNEDFDLFKSSEIISLENYGESISNDLEVVMKLNAKQNTMNYAPLSPELSPLLESDNVIYSSDQILKNCIKKNDNNIFTSMNSLNNILSITPEMESINSPIIETKIDNFTNNNIQDDFVNNFTDPFKTINNRVEENPDNLLTVDNDDYLNAPATPNSITYSSSPNNFDLSDFPNVIMEPFEFNDELNKNGCNYNETDVNEINSDKEEQKQSKECQNSIEKILGDLDLSEQIKNIIPTIEPISKRPRGRPRKNKSEQIPKSPKEKIEQLSQSIEQILSSDLYKKLCSEDGNESIINSEIHPKKISNDQDYKFVKQVNTLNYILVSYKRMRNALCKINENDKQTISDATENQYDIPVEKMEDEKDEIKENEDIEEINNEIENKNNNRNEDEMDSITEEEESSESENEEKSLLLLKKEIHELNSNTKDENNIEEENKEAIIPIKSIETAKNGRKRKQGSEDDSDSSNEGQNKRKVVRLSIKQIKNSLENGNRMSIGNGLGVNSVSALTKNGLVLVGRKRIIAENTNRPYVCSTCGAGFVRKHDLNRHEKVHTGIKNYKCPYCDRAFSRNDALSRHLRVELKHRSQNNEKKRGRKGNKKKATKKEN